MGLYDDLRWYMLNEHERELAECTRKGEDCVFRSGKKLDPQKRESWDGQPEIRGKVISALAISELKDGDGIVIRPTSRGVNLYGARIPDGFYLSHARVDVPLALFKCLIAGTISILQSRLATVAFSDSRIEGSEEPESNNETITAIRGDGAQIDGGLFLKNVSVRGEVRLLGADIGGNLECIGGTFENPKGKAFSADRLKTSSSVRFDNVTTKGEVRLHGADIGNNLECAGGTFENQKGIAFGASHLKAGGNVRFDRAKIKGEVILSGAHIEGQLSCANLQFEKSFDEKDARAFIAQNAVIEGIFFWRDFDSTPKGIIDLRHMHVGVLADDLSVWSEKRMLGLDGFEYRTIASDSPTDSTTRLAWLGLMPSDKYIPQPYRQLAKVLHQMGHERDARKIAIARMDAYRDRGKVSRARKFWFYIIRWTAGYGYEPWQIWRSALATFLIGLLVFWLSFNSGGMIPAKEEVFLDKCYELNSGSRPPKWERDCESWIAHERSLTSNPLWLPPEYPEFSAIWFSLDALLPIVDLHQESYWLPDGRDEWSFPRIYLWFHILIGWGLTSILVAAFTGIVKDKDD